MKKKELIVARCLMVVVALYFFYNTNLLTFSGYSLAVDGVVVARTLLLIFSMLNFLEVLKELRK